VRITISRKTLISLTTVVMTPAVTSHCEWRVSMTTRHLGWSRVIKEDGRPNRKQLLIVRMRDARRCATHRLPCMSPPLRRPIRVRVYAVLRRHWLIYLQLECLSLTDSEMSVRDSLGKNRHFLCSIPLGFYQKSGSVRLLYKHPKRGLAWFAIGLRFLRMSSSLFQFFFKQNFSSFSSINRVCFEFHL